MNKNLNGKIHKNCELSQIIQKELDEKYKESKLLSA
jgi:hypothetical protein